MAVSDPSLESLGWDDDWDAARLEAGAEISHIGRVARVDRGRVTVITASGTTFASPAGHDVATGDWVVIDGDDVRAVLPRRSAFVRGDPMEGAARGPQVVAANIDIVLVMQALTNGPNLRRFERELVLAFESGATPVIVLTKADLVDEQAVDDAVTSVASIAAGVEVIVASAVTGAGVDAVLDHARDNRTIALIGASGVGKSTLVNRLVGHDVQDTGAVRAGDQRGRHTTTARELVLLSGGGVLVDTPGLRAVSLWDADDGFSRAFADIESLAEACRFSDCSHTVEPGCAVRAAIERGELDAARVEHYNRLDAELDAAERKRRERVLSKDIRRLRRDGGIRD